MHKYLITLIGWFAVISFAICFSACSVRAVQEAQAVVTQADSLRMQGQAYSDSAQLAQAYCTLHRRRAFYPDAYAHCCYHYGRLLRAHDDPVAAMQVFINATHSRTRDYAILGRIYSNFGEMAHLAGEFELSYDMFERSGEMFLITGDTVAYCYALNDMAFEYAQQGKKEETLVLLSQIEKNSTEKYVLSKVLETKAVACLYSQQYDSAVIYAKRMINKDNHEPTGYLVCAQAYSYAGDKDSAVHYARIVLQKSQNLFHRNNALYILTNDAQDSEKEEIRQVAADRSDVQKLIETRHGKLTQAVQLLEQDLTRIPDKVRIIIANLVLLVIIISLSVVYSTIHHKREQIKRGLLSQQEQQKYLDRQHANILQKRMRDLEFNCAMLRNSKHLKSDLDWEHYDSMCTIVNTRLYSIAEKLQNKQGITANNVRLCILVLIELPYDEIANILNLSPKSIAKLKSLTAHKLGATMKNLRENLVQMACQDSIK